jgi:DNA-binding transcriptional ArsR family regulator
MAIKLNKPLNNIFDQFSKLKVLRFLIRTEAELSGREMARAVGISHVICSRSLQELAQHGLVTMKKVGRSILYSLNKQHILVDEMLIPLFKKEESLFQSLTKEILRPLSEQKPISLTLFGSQIDEERARPDSDFDILCIIPDKINLKKFKNALSQSESLVEKRFGNYASLLIMKKTDFLKRRKMKDPLILEIEEQNRLLFGKHIREIK